MGIWHKLKRKEKFVLNESLVFLSPQKTSIFAEDS